jgi:predicted trehalose synthase
VAGVLRSLDYAAMASRQQRRMSEKLNTPESRALFAWREQTTDGFLSAYQEAIGASVLWPDRTEDMKSMLNFFLLEKALYEVEYSFPTGRLGFRCHCKRSCAFSRKEAWSRPEVEIRQCP